MNGSAVADVVRSRSSVQSPTGKARPARDAFVSVRFYMFWGLVWGFLLLGVGQVIESYKPIPELRAEGLSIWRVLLAVRFLSEHLGVGFIVSSIAVFFYEWGAHSRKVFELADKLTSELDRQVDLTESQSLSIKPSLAAMLKGKAQSLETAQVLESLFSTVVGLHNSESWASDRYLKVVLDLLREVQANAQSLQNPGDNHLIVPRIAAVIADAVLAAQMSAMGREESKDGQGDTYKVISDLSSWQGRSLENFRAETKDAVMNRGIKVQRVFNVLNESTSTLTSAETSEILRRHLEDAESWTQNSSGGSYEVGVIGAAESQGLGGEHEDTMHWGIFDHAGKKVRFAVNERDLSDLSFTNDMRVIRKNEESFVKVWGSAKKFAPQPADAGGLGAVVSGREEFITSVVDRFLNKRRFSQINDLRKSLDPDFLSIFGEHFDSTMRAIADIIEKREMLLENIDDYRYFYKRVLLAYPTAKFCATSLPRSSYFWDQEGIREQSVEEAIHEFITKGGDFERIFFTKDPEGKLDQEEENIMAVQAEMRVEVFYTPERSLSRGEGRYFLVADNLKFAAEAFLGLDNRISRVLVTLDREKILPYWNIFTALKSRRDMRVFSARGGDARIG